MAEDGWDEGRRAWRGVGEEVWEERQRGEVRNEDE